LIQTATSDSSNNSCSYFSSDTQLYGLTGMTEINESSTQICCRAAHTTYFGGVEGVESSPGDINYVEEDNSALIKLLSIAGIILVAMFIL